MRVCECTHEVSADEFLQLEHDPGPNRHRGVSPRWESSLGRSHSRLELGRSAEGDAGNDLLGGLQRGRRAVGIGERSWGTWGRGVRAGAVVYTRHSISECEWRGTQLPGLASNRFWEYRTGVGNSGGEGGWRAALCFVGLGLRIEWEGMGGAQHSRDCGRRSIRWLRNSQTFLRSEASP